MKLEAGMYVRTKSGIARIVEFRERENNLSCYYLDRNIMEEDKCLSNCIYDYKYYKEQILKVSYDIIDLIKPGDYVNGYKVSFKDKDYKPFVQCDYPVQEGTTNHYRFYEEAIYLIVTKEQFESMKYIVERDD